MALIAQGKYDEAMSECQAAILIEPKNSKIHYLLGNTFLAEHKLADAIQEYENVLQLDPEQQFCLNDLAWLLATAPDARLRNGSRAVILAEQNCQLSNYHVTFFVGTLAAAYAEAGRFDDATKTAQKAIALAMTEKNQTLIQKNRELLELYQHHQAYHEP